jgi:hypothetical protein
LGDCKDALAKKGLWSSFLIYAICEFQDERGLGAGGYTKDIPGLFVWLPRTIDDSSEEAQKRSLWVMVNWKMFECISPQAPGGYIKIYQWNKEVGLFSDKVCSWCSPTEAILKALCSQEGVTPCNP